MKDGSPDLRTEQTRAIFHTLGNVKEDSARLNRKVNGLMTTDAQSFNKKLGT